MTGNTDFDFITEHNQQLGYKLEEENQVEQQLYNLIKSEYDIKKVQSQRILFIDGSTKRIDAFIKEITDSVADYLGAEEVLAYMKLSDRLRTREVIKQVNRVVKEQEAEREALNDSEYGISLEDFVILTDIFDDDSENLIYDMRNRELSPYSTKKVEAFVGSKQFNILDRYPCKFVYDPLSGKDASFSDYKHGQNVLKKVNIYKHPEWRRVLDDNSSSSSLDSDFDSMPESAQVFFKHLFPNKKSLEYALDWLYVALTSEQGNEHILVLNGPTGTGKTIFCSDLLIALVGEKNWGTAPKNLFESTFNKVLLNKRIIFIDEARINERDYNTVKLYANKRLNVEKKGVDADNTSDLYFSMALSNNKIGNIYVDPDDRRFSILDTTNNKLKKELGEHFPGEFVNDLKDVDFIGKIGRYILGRRVNEEDFILDQYKGERFYKFVQRHLSQWQKVVVGRVFKVGKEEEDEIEISSLVSAISANKHIRYDVQPDTVIEFIESYLHGIEQQPLGMVERDEDGDDILKINPYYVEGQERLEDML